MMEVKQSTPRDFNALSAATSNGKPDDLDVISELEGTKLKSDLLNTNDLPQNGLLSDVSNGFTDAGDGLDLDELIDLNEAVNPDLEDALLGEDDESDSNVVDKLLAEVVPKAAAVGSKTECGSAAASLHNPGDDLDKLISKINDLEDCIETSTDKDGAASSVVVSNDNSVKADEGLKSGEEKQAIKEKKDDIKDAKENDKKEESDGEKLKLNEDIVVNEAQNCDKEVATDAKNVMDNSENNELGETVEKEKSEVIGKGKGSESDLKDDHEGKEVEINTEKMSESPVLAEDEEIGEKLEETKETSAKEPEDDNGKRQDSDEVVESNECNESILEISDDKIEITEEDKTEVLNNDELVKADSVTDETTKVTDNTDATVNKEAAAEKTDDKDEEKVALSAENVDEKESEGQLEKVKETTSNEGEKVKKQIESAADTKSKSPRAEDSDDDDIIFFVGKPEAEKKPADSVVKSVEVVEKTKLTDGSSEKESTATENVATRMAVDDDDDVVLLLDDDEESMVEQKPTDTAEKTAVVETDKIVTTPDETKSKESKDSIETRTELKKDKIESEAVDKSELKSDNSDNACDKFETDKSTAVLQKDDETKSKSSDGVDETNSNCSNSSNLLQETRTIAKIGVRSSGEEDADVADEPENDDDADDAESSSAIEMVEDDSRAAGEEKETAPPAKRIRLSDEADDSLKAEHSEESHSSNKSGDSAPKEDGVFEVIKIAEDSNDADNNDKSLVTQATGGVKRSHESLDLSNTDVANDDAVAEVANKKSKIEGESISIESSLKQEAEKVGGSELVEVDKKTIADLKDQREKLEKLDEKLEFGKVLPQLRAVASDIPIPLYPAPKFQTSPPALSLDFLKRFRKNFDTLTKSDLEELVLQKVVEAIVHKSEFAEMREIIDKQEKQITAHRAKIAEITKQFRDLEMVHNRVLKDIETKNSQFIMPVKITRAVGLQVYVPSKRNSESGSSLNTLSGSHLHVSTSPQRSQMPPPSSPPRQPTSTSDSRAGNSALASAAVAAAMNARRGCVQKVTPQRPVNPDSSMPTTTAVSTYRIGSGVLQTALTQGSQSGNAATSQQSPGMPRVLNKGVASGQPRPGRFLPIEQQRSQQLQQQQQQQQQQQYGRQQAQNAGLRKMVPKAGGNVIAPQSVVQFRRPIESSGTTPNPSVDHYITQLNQASPAVGTVTITSAKPKEKAVIDLTDEDEVASAATTPPVRQRTANTANTGIGNNPQTLNTTSRAVPPLTRMPMGQQTAVRPPVGMRQQQVTAAPKTNNSALMSNISTPPGTSITRVHISSSNMPAAPVRKYNHPAPLPSTPPQPFNPAWKLPPPRPTIRISNLENGIVISWTMEDSMDRFAECVTYQIYAYQETSGPPAVDSWRHVGDVKAMLLPMAVTLTQFQEGQRYYFAVRAVDEHKRLGPFSLPKTWT